MNNKEEFWLSVIRAFEQEQLRAGYSKHYVKEQVKCLKRLLREFGDLGEIDDKAIWQRYMYHSKSYRTQMTNALKAFKKWLNGGVQNGQD